MSNPSSNPKEIRTGSQVRSNVVEGVVTIYVDGRFDFNCHQQFRRAYEGFPGMREYVVDLSATEYLDSSALGMLLVLREQAGRAKLRIVNCKPAVRRILDIANFKTLFALE